MSSSVSAKRITRNDGRRREATAPAREQKSNGVQVAGKTGTAETNKECNDSWFVGFAPSDNPSVAVAVLIEEGVHGTDESGLASVRAQKVLTSALQAQGLL